MGGSVRTRVSILALPRLIGTRFGAQANGEAIPAVNRNQGEGQIRQFGLIEMLAYLLVQLIWNMVLGNKCDSFRPRQGCALPFRVVRGLAPGHQAIEALLAFAPRAGIFPVHIDTVGAAVDLR